MTKTIRFHSWWLLVAAALGILLALMPVELGAATTEELDRLVASLEGGWTGEDNMTPFGKMDFAMLFKRQPDGSLHSRSSLNRETYIDLRFSKAEEGRWVLREEAAMEGLGVQTHDLVPSPNGEQELADGMHRWIHAERPDYLQIDVGRVADTLFLNVVLRGENHVQFKLDRLPDDELAEFERGLEEASRRSPSEGASIADVVENPPSYLVEPENPIDVARQAVAESPADAEAHLALARVLGDAINTDPANGPRFAFEMRSSLENAIELDPALAEAYHWLVGYYLNAPPIAGGSIERAEATARRLAEFDPKGGQTLLEQVSARRLDGDSGTE
ncbi:MAG: hypothetical protein OES47_15720 [Acidobacteriota bacterium]|nr:hypothetical protein [Acidobacteriota bacterium]